MGGWLQSADWVLFWTLAFGGVMGFLFFLLSLPLRRQERARFFLDFLALALRRGMPVEQAIVAASHSRDPSLGVRFHLLASWLEKGFPLSQALERTPGLLPPAILAQLRVGERIGNLAQVLPGCHDLANVVGPQFLKAQNYIAMLPLCLATVGMIWLVPMMMVFVMPKFMEIIKDMETQAPALIQFLSRHVHSLTMLSILTGVCLLLFIIPVFFYVGGPRFARWITGGLPPVFDGWLLRVPWHRQRCERNFSGALGVLLDANVPEAEAVRLAAQCAGNRVFNKYGAQVAGQLQAGQTLPQALALISQNREFHWRLANACASPHSFTAALRGWQEALEARAFHWEQVFVQTATTGLVLINGALVGLLAVAMFQTLVVMMEGAALW